MLQLSTIRQLKSGDHKISLRDVAAQHKLPVDCKNWFQWPYFEAEFARYNFEKNEGFTGGLRMSADPQRYQTRQIYVGIGMPRMTHK